MSSQRFFFFFLNMKDFTKNCAGFNFKPPQISRAVTPLFTASCEKPTPGPGVVGLCDITKGQPAEVKEKGG